MGKKAIQFGVGNIGRGFIGLSLYEGGYQLLFADVAKGLIDRINEVREYTVHIRDFNSRDIKVSGVSGLYCGDGRLPEQIARADIITTAVGLNNLEAVAKNLAPGLAKRKSMSITAPLNIIACENGLRATSFLKEAVYALLDPELVAWVDVHVGFPDAAVDRIVPPAKFENPLDSAVEEYCEWVTDRNAFKGGVPQLDDMKAVDNLDAYMERKIFTLNTGHATAAYLGLLKGYETIGECMADSEIYSAVKGAMKQSGDALIGKYGFDPALHYAYIEKTIKRFLNPYLRDVCTRVGREPLRKLASTDRLILPILNCRRLGLPYEKLVLATAACLHFDNPQDRESVEMQASIREAGVKATIVKYSGIDMGDPLVYEIEKAYTTLNRK